MFFNDGLSREKTNPLIYIKNQRDNFYMIRIYRVCVYQQILVISNMIYLKIQFDFALYLFIYLFIHLKEDIFQ